MLGFFRQYQKKRFYSGLIGRKSVCFDIGANVGTKSLLFLSLGAKVIAFEPQSACLEILAGIRQKNPNFDFYPFAVGAKNEQKELHLANHSEVATLSEDFMEYFSGDAIHWNRRETVTVKPLDELIATFGLPDFCKIDTEGYEWEILSQLSHTIPVIEFEFTGGFTNDTLRIIELLDKDGASFNFILNEKLKFRLPKWVSGVEMKALLASLPKNRLHGNIFVKYN